MWNMDAEWELICLVLRPGSRVKVTVVTRARVGDMVSLYFAVVLCNFSQFYELRNGNYVRIRVGVRIKVMVKVSLRVRVIFYFAEVLRCLRYFTAMGKMRNCVMRKVKCGMKNAERR